MELKRTRLRKKAKKKYRFTIALTIPDFSTIQRLKYLTGTRSVTKILTHALHFYYNYVIFMIYFEDKEIEFAEKHLNKLISEDDLDLKWLSRREHEKKLRDKERGFKYRKSEVNKNDEDQQKFN